MKFGVRKLSLKKSFKANTTGKLKRKMKKAVNPFYGKKGIGLITNPKKSLYNKVYSKTSVNLLKKSSNKNEALIHILLFMFTAGIGNIIYLIYKNN